MLAAVLLGLGLLASGCDAGIDEADRAAPAEAAASDREEPSQDLDDPDGTASIDDSALRDDPALRDDSALRDEEAWVPPVPPEPPRPRWEPPFEPADVRDGRPVYSEAQVVDALVDGDPRVRAWAVGRLDIEGEDLGRLIQLSAQDADPDVRVAAVEQLAPSEAPEGMGALVSALGDRDPSVVLAAIDALTFAGDETTVPSLEPLLQHRDDEIRQAAEDAIDFLR